MRPASRAVARSRLRRCTLRRQRPKIRRARVPGSHGRRTVIRRVVAEPRIPRGSRRRQPGSRRPLTQVCGRQRQASSAAGSLNEDVEVGGCRSVAEDKRQTRHPPPSPRRRGDRARVVLPAGSWSATAARARHRAPRRALAVGNTRGDRGHERCSPKKPGAFALHRRGNHRTIQLPVLAAAKAESYSPASSRSVASAVVSAAV